MEIVFLPKALEDQEYWKSIGDKRIMKRISKLLADIQLHPFTGIGKPEPLKGSSMVCGAEESTTNTVSFIPSAAV